MNLSGGKVGAVARTQGFTLVELMMTLMVAAILLAVAVPSFRAVTANNALRTTTADLVTAIHTARAQAVNQRAPVTLAASGSWSDGWTLDYADTGTIMTDQTFTPAGGVTISTGVTTLTFRPSGLVSATATFSVCDGRSGETGRKIVVGRFGTVDNQSITCN